MKSFVLSFLFVCVVALPIGAEENSVRVGSDRLEEWIPLLEGRRVALAVNQTSRMSETHTFLADTLLARGVRIVALFAPEHGLQGDSDAGEIVENRGDTYRGVPVYSLYGQAKKPSSKQLRDVDILLFDMQDVGVRFYTYISTMFYLMQACAEADTPMWVLDRPNPCDYVDGPVLEEGLHSFVGTLPLPVLHGLTVGELARMIKGENWGGTAGLDLTIVPVTGWKHGDAYSLPVKPSPNLPNDKAIAFYPSLCFFEATQVSVGRGTYMPFQVVGYPDPSFGDFSFTPVSLPGFDKNPLQCNKVCYGIDLRDSIPPKGITLRYLFRFFQLLGCRSDFFSSPLFFDKLMGTSQVRQGMLEGKSETEIRTTWQEALAAYRILRRKYLLYPDNRGDL
ncbi:MAG: DUF1343 domain-containing protein [Porphyromonadaceae bacterium]|nr:DUF1343 domain-containing protein [Porphyromonadaceae bacterium]